ncbi:MAG: hypothetical protein LC804_11935 [Acidobacteria bacterium]|nr:hypothetical protein [Acidobacteriota bacterium]
MNDALNSYVRWRTADDSGRDDDADGAFRTVYQTVVPEEPVSPQFTARAMAGIAAAGERDARRARRTRAALVSGTVVGGSAAAYFGGAWIVSAFSTVFIGLLNLLIAAIVQGASGLETGASFWSVLAAVPRGRAAGAARAHRAAVRRRAPDERRGAHTQDAHG